MFGERVRGGSHEALAQVGISLRSHHTEGGGREGRCDEESVPAERPKYSRERGAGRERRTGGIFKSKKLEA